MRGKQASGLLRQTGLRPVEQPGRLFAVTARDGCLPSRSAGDSAKTTCRSSSDQILRRSTSRLEMLERGEKFALHLELKVSVAMFQDRRVYPRHRRKGLNV